MAAWTTQRSGTWSDDTAAGPWRGGSNSTVGVPGDGDTVVIATGHAITASSDTTVGLSGASGTIALTIQSTTGSLTLTNGAKLYLRGDLSFAASASFTDGLVVSAGSGICFDPPVGSYYRFAYGTGTVLRIVRFNGTASNHCTLSTTNRGGSNGNFAIAGFGGNVVARYTDFSNLGYSSQARSLWLVPGTTSANHIYDVQHCTFNNCHKAVVNAVSNGQNTPIVHKYNTHRNTVSSVALHVDCRLALGTGAREIVGNSFDRTSCCGDFAASGGLRGVTVNDNYFGGGFVCVGNNALHTLASFDRNVVRHWSGGGSLSIPADIKDVYFLTEATNNAHSFSIFGCDRDWLIDRAVVDAPFVGTTDPGDSFVVSAPASARVATLTRNLVLPNLGNKTSGPITLFGSSAPNANIVVEHNTIFIGGYSALNCENNTNTTGQINSFKSNLLWTFPFSTGPTTKISGSGGAPNCVDVGAPANLDYNAVDSRCDLGRDNGYRQPTFIGSFTSTPGEHDVTVDDAQFVDSTRNFATFYGYLVAKGLAPTPAEWTTGTPYAVGDVVAYTNPSIYNGAVIHYRCLSAHTAGAASEPVCTAAAKVYWEFATAKVIEDAVSARSTITDSALCLTNADYPSALWAWVRAGFAPSATALKGAAHDGGDIGAVGVAVLKRSSAQKSLSVCVSL